MFNECSCVTVLSGNGVGVEMGLHGDLIQSPAGLGGLVALPSWTQSQVILEVAAITALIEAAIHDCVFVAEVSLSCLLLIQAGSTTFLHTA